METRVTFAFWAIDIFLVAGPILMPAQLPIELAWFGLALAAILLAYAVFPRRLIPQRWRRESAVKEDAKDMAKFVAFKIDGDVSGLTVDGARAYGFDDFTWVEAEGSLKDVMLKDSIAVSGPRPEQASERVEPIVKGHPLLTRAFRKRQP